MTSHRARVTARELLLAGASARWRRYSTLDRRIDFRDTARAPEWLSGDVLARLAEPDMTKVRAVMNTAGEFLATDYHAKVPTFRIATLASNWAANFLALMLLTLLQLIAHAV